MRLAKELIGKPVFSVSDGRQLGAVKDVYLDLELGTLNGLFLGHEGLFSRKARVIARKDIVVLGVDAVLVTGPGVVTDSNELPEIEMWLRREELQGRGIDTPGGTKVGSVGDVFFDENANVVGYSLARVHVEGPVAENRIVLKEAVIDTGSRDGIMTIDLAKAERPEASKTEASPLAQPAESLEPIELSSLTEPEEESEE